MQKRSKNVKIISQATDKRLLYKTEFAPLPVSSDAPLYVDDKTFVLPKIEDFLKIHYHNRYELGLCYGGKGLFLSDKNHYVLSDGDVVFIPPNVKHYSRSLDDSGCCCRFMYFSVETINVLLKTIGVDVNALMMAFNKGFPAVISATEYQYFSDMVKTMFYSYDNIKNVESILLKFSSFLLEIHDTFNKNFFGSNLNVYNTNTDTLMDEVAKYLYLNYDKPTPVQGLTELFMISESQLRKRFIKIYGVSPIKFKNRLRVEIASKLLKQSDLSINEVSQKVGFNSTSDFYRHFKYFYGASPILFKKSK
ncbi:MAG: helix-turn-helix transcriptional regulator [Clostridia bacterium]|nr:helix-turn-helix transcriptional regulator [Clostridia bacterium]